MLPAGSAGALRLSEVLARNVRSTSVFADPNGDRMREGARYLVGTSLRHAGLRRQVPQGALVHVPRHTFGTPLPEDGADATEIQALLGHESLNTSHGYIDATAARTRQAARANRTYRPSRSSPRPAQRPPHHDARGRVAPCARATSSGGVLTT